MNLKEDFLKKTLTIIVLFLLFQPYAHSQVINPIVTGKNDTSGYLKINGVNLFFRAVGHGTPLIILHGGPGLSQGYMAPQFIRLLSDDYRLIFYDQRASGRSTGVDDTTRLTMSQFVLDLEEVRQKLGLKQMNLLGHSFGGLLAMYYGIKYPSHIKKLVLLNSDAASDSLRTPYANKMINKRLTKKEKREIKEIESKKGAFNDPAAMDRDLRITLRTYFYNPNLVDSLHLKFNKQSLKNANVTNRVIRRNLGNYNIYNRLHRITAPTLILHGDASVFSVKGSVAIQKQIPNSRLIILKNVGHFSYIEAPQVFRAAIEAFIW